MIIFYGFAQQTRSVAFPRSTPGRVGLDCKQLAESARLLVLRPLALFATRLQRC